MNSELEKLKKEHELKKKELRDLENTITKLRKDRLKSAIDLCESLELCDVENQGNELVFYFKPSFNSKYKNSNERYKMEFTKEFLRMHLGLWK